jgi:ferric-dicitrate binding protein FerR (iron transport regulator)
MPAIDVKRAVDDALEDARDGLLDPQRLASVRRLLATSAEARRYYLEANALLHALAAEPRPAIDAALRAGRRCGDKPTTAASRRPPLRLLVATIIGSAAAILLVAGLIEFLSPPAQPGDVPRVIATLEQVSGNVRVTSADAQTPAIDSPTEIRSGDTVRTQGGLSSAVLVYPDGTRLSLVGNTSLTASERDRKSIVLHGGTMFGAVSSQPADRPLLVTTPQDSVQVLGTRFSLDATRLETDLRVSEGRVRLTRLQDGKSVEVPAGRRVVSSAASALVVEAIPNTPDEWSEDFEEGLPEDWGGGKFVAADLPAGSQGAVRATRDGESPDSVAIASQDQWTSGLFTVHDDTQLHFTLKMQDPGWFNILILTRTAAGDPPTFAGNYIYDQQSWFGAPGEWGTVSIPLKSFRPLPPSQEGFEGVMPFQIVFSCPARERGLVIDRVWVSRGKENDE